MSLFDTADGVFMSAAYGWAFLKPVRKVFYNLTITALSVMVALVIGVIELLQLLGTELGVTDGVLGAVQALNLESMAASRGDRSRRSKWCPRVSTRAGRLHRSLPTDAMPGGCADAPTREAGVRAQYPPPPPPPPEPPPPYRTKNAMTTTTSTATPAINHTFLVMFTSPGYRTPSALSV